MCDCCKCEPADKTVSVVLKESQADKIEHFSQFLGYRSRSSFMREILGEYLEALDFHPDGSRRLMLSLSNKRKAIHDV